ncbi:MAG: PAS domain S-box protein [Bacteroidota bacterium]|nr:PAS domain S-box protein [Bacteroidota bacterium]MDP4196191.1 PAS domain S-box protein [Bacteroidota bacterium]
MKKEPGQKYTVDFLTIIGPQLPAAIDNLAEGFAICTPEKDQNGLITDFIYLYVNNSISEMSGMKKEEMIGRRMSEIIPGFLESEYFDLCKKTANNEETNIIRSAYVKKLVKDKKLVLDKEIERYFDINITSCKSGIIITSQDITESKIKEFKLHESEERFRLMANSIPQLSALADANGNIYWYNDRWYEYTGTTPEEMTGLGWQRVHDPNVLPEVMKNWTASIKTGEPFEMIFPLRGKDGLFRSFLTRIWPLKNSEGKVIQWVGTNTDITEHIKAEQEVKRERELLESLLNSIPVMITIFDPGTNVFRFNQYLKNVYGYLEEDAVNGSFMELAYPDPDYRNEAIKYMQSFEPGWREFVAFAKDGSQIESSWSNIRLPDGIQIGIGIDLREAKRTERKLRESQEKLLDAQKLAHLGSFTLDLESKKLEWTEEVFRIYERKLELGQPTFEESLEYIHPDDKQYMLDNIQRAQNNKESVKLEYRIVTDEGKIKYLSYIGTSILGDKRLINKRFGTVLDITERKIVELRLKKTLEELARSNQELEQFAYIASHDLQEPLRMISSFIRMFEMKYKNRIDEKANEYIWQIVDGANRMSSLIQDLLSYARVTTKKESFADTELNAIISEIRRDLQVAIVETKTSIEVDFLPEIKADATQMKQLLQNLIQNSLKFRNKEKTFIKISAELKDKEWIFTVKDNGIGIKSEDFDRIFMLFQRLNEKDKYPGTGIGLAICKRIVERHGGHIWLESEEGKGTTFYFSIPVR